MCEGGGPSPALTYDLEGRTLVLPTRERQEVDVGDGFRKGHELLMGDMTWRLGCCDSCDWPAGTAHLAHRGFPGWTGAAGPDFLPYLTGPVLGSHEASLPEKVALATRPPRVICGPPTSWLGAEAAGLSYWALSPPSPAFRKLAGGVQQTGNPRPVG